MTRVPGNFDGRDGTRQITTFLVWTIVVIAALGAVAGVGTAAGSADLYVDATDASGPNEYGTIQAAVDNATSGDVIQVNATGPYHGTVNVTENVTIVSDGATLVGDGTGTAFTINDSLSSVTIEGLAIEEYAVAADGHNATANLTLRNLTVRNVTTAAHVSAPDSTQQVLLEDARIDGTTGPAITVDNASGSVVVRNTTFRNVATAIEANTSTTVDAATDNTFSGMLNPCNGDQSGDANGDGHVNCGLAAANDAGTSADLDIRVNKTAGTTDPDTPHPTIQAGVNATDDGFSTVYVAATGPYSEQVTVDRNLTITTDGATISGGSGTAITLQDSIAHVTIEGLTVRGYTTGVDGGSLGGAVSLVNVTLDQLGGEAIAGNSSSGTWMLRNVTISDSSIGIKTTSTSGNWTISETAFLNNDQAVTANANSDWTFRNVTAVGTQANDILRFERTGGDVTIADSRFTGGDYAINAIEPGGTWTIRNATFRGHTRAGITVIDSTGPWTVSNSTFVNNSAYDIDAEFASSVIDAATGNTFSGTLNPCNGDQAGDANGDGYVNCGLAAANDAGTSADLDIQVDWATGNNSDPDSPYTTVQAGVNAADDGFSTVYVAATGPYHNAVNITKNLSVVGTGGQPTLNGSTASTADGVTIGDNVSVTMRDLQITDYGQGIVATNVTADVTLDNVNISRAFQGIHVDNVTGNWTLRQVDFTHPNPYGIRSYGSNISWELRNVTYEADPDDAGGAILEQGNSVRSTWTIHDSTFSGASGITGAVGAEFATTRTVRLDNVTFRSFDERTVTILSSDVHIEDSLLANGESGPLIRAQTSTGDVTLVDTILRNADESVINARDTTGNWSLSNVTVTGGGPNGTAHGIYAVGASGNWSITGSAIRDNIETGLFAANVTGAWSIADTAFKSNGGWGIDATGASPEIAAAVKTVFASNAIGACTGNVDCGYPPARPTGVSGAGPITADNVTAYDVTIELSDSFEGDTVSVRLSDGATNITETASADAGTSNVTFTLNASALGEGDIAVYARTSDENGTSGFEQFATVTKNATASTSGSTGGSGGGDSATSSSGGGGQTQDSGPTVSGFTAESLSPGTIRISFDSQYQLLQMKVSLDGATDHVLRKDAFTFEDGTYVATVTVDGTGRYTAVLERGVTETGEEVSGNLDTVHVSSGSSTDQHQSSASTASTNSDSVAGPSTASDENAAGGDGSDGSNAAGSDTGSSPEQGWTTPLAYGTGALGVMALLAILVPVVLLYRRHEKEREYGDMEQL